MAGLEDMALVQVATLLGKVIRNEGLLSKRGYFIVCQLCSGQGLVVGD